MTVREASGHNTERAAALIAPMVTGSQNVFASVRMLPSLPQVSGTHLTHERLRKISPDFFTLHVVFRFAPLMCTRTLSLGPRPTTLSRRPRQGTSLVPFR